MNTLVTSAVGSFKVCLKYADFTFTHSSCGDETFCMAGVSTLNSTSHNKAPLLTCHDSSSCRASASGTGGPRLKTQVKAGRQAGTQKTSIQTLHQYGIFILRVLKI